MICPKCGNAITHNSYFDAYYCPRCGEFIRDKPPMTNADRIRSLSNDGLKAWYCKNRDCGDCDFCQPFGCTFDEWLQQPAEEDDHA